ncbi:VEGF [Pseudocowpox virus]|uniref:VEGF n=1 Tax=Pseudocowpox virus TaxID=129726 RepID=Q8B571_9POXV|nr:VEGF [Pseudocowpox virus]YP_003457435.1 VEGF [Pseudocowpox virus]AAO16216.1 vascular endothelial growth factor-like protein [Pseudocowpox virus]ADC53902.1 VEGF [Pseudocowpox virus]ADC54031.1 VEGF [Pseudocowpox virus]
MKLITTLQFAVALLICMYNLPECFSGSTGGSSSGGSSSASSLSSWLDTSEKSSCKPRDTVVQLISEYPGDVEQRYNPRCVTVRRCGGCCNDESQICTAIETANVTVTVMLTGVSGSTGATSNFQTISVEEHTKCKCEFQTSPPTTTTTKEPR